MLAIWTNGTAKPFPPEDLTLYLCQNVYHCLPDELRRQDALEINKHLEILNIREEARLKPVHKGFTGTA